MTGRPGLGHSRPRTVQVKPRLNVPAGLQETCRLESSKYGLVGRGGEPRR